MNVFRCDDLTRASPPSRRALLAGLASGLVAALPLALAANDGLAKRKKKRKKKKKKTPVPPTVPPPPSPLAFAYQCLEPAIGVTQVPGNARLAQTFAASRGGSLREIQFLVTNDGGADAYIVQLLKVNGTIPGDSAADVLATAMVPSPAVSSDPFTLLAQFTGPVLAQGTTYAAAITRPGPGQLIVHVPDGQGMGIACGGDTFGAASTGAFTPTAPPRDFVSAVLVV